MSLIALTIAGSDSSGGAGIQADLKTFAAFGVYGASVITALTAQNTLGVTAVHTPPPDFLAAQIDAVFSDLAVVAVKVGMLADVASVRVVADRLRHWRPHYLVIDPVMVASSGRALMDEDALAVFAEELMPLASLLTPNLPEAARLCMAPQALTREEVAGQAAALLARGPAAVLVKGGHGDGDSCEDLLLAKTSRRWYAAPREKTGNTHGTGCTLSSAIAAGLVLGNGLERAVGDAKAYVTAAIRAGAKLHIGHGGGPLDHSVQWIAGERTIGE